MRRNAFLLLALGAGLWPGCQCGELEVKNPRLVAYGRFASLWGHPWGEKQKYVLTEKLDEQGRVLDQITVLDVASRRPCDLPVRNPRWFWSVGDSLMVLEAIDWDRWVGRLTHLAMPCGPPRVLFEEVYLAVWRDPAERFFYVLAEVDRATRRGRLVRVDWPSGDVRDVRRGVRTDHFGFDWPDPRFFYRDASGELVAARLTDGGEEGRFGTGVTYWTSSGDGEVLYEQRPRLFRARVDGRNLFQLSEDGCGPTFSDARVVFVEPCGGPRQIVVLDRRSNGLLGRHGSSVAVHRTHPEGWLSWIEGPELGGPGALWVKPPGEEPLLVADNASAEWFIQGERRYVLYAAMTGPAVARLVSLDLRSGQRRVLADDVDPSLAIAESPWSPHFALVSGLRSVSLPDGGTAPDRLGTLMLVHPTAEEKYEVAAAVPVRGFQFSWQAPAIGYLREFDAVRRTGTFEVVSMVDRKLFPVDVGVREFAEVFAPIRGVVYIGRAPGREGLYLVEAEVSLF